MSVDIEASSSHGDFPLPKKNYKKLANNIVDLIQDKNITPTNDFLKECVKRQELSLYVFSFFFIFFR